MLISATSLAGKFVPSSDLARAPVPPAAGFAVRLLHPPARATQDDEQHHQIAKLFPVHFADVRFRLKTAKPIPDSATTTGMPRMFSPLQPVFERVDFLRQLLALIFQFPVHIRLLLPGIWRFPPFAPAKR